MTLRILTSDLRERMFAGAIFVLTLLTLVSCGGGSGGIVTNPNPNPNPTPTPTVGDFQLIVGSPAFTLQQGGAPQFQVVQANPVNGFSGTINLTLSGLPAGVTTISPAPLSISVTGFPQGTALQLAAALNAPLATSTITVTGTSGPISHSITFNLTVRQAAPFAIQLSPPSVSLPAAAAATVQVSVTSNSGPAPQLAVNVSGAPNGSQVRVGSPQGFVTPTSPGSILIEALVLAQPLQSFPLSVIASDNANNTAFLTLPLTVTVPFASNPAPTRSTFIRTDVSPTGMVYDPLRKLVFVSVEILNQVLVLSAADGHQIASIPVYFPAGIDVAADESVVYVVSPFVGGVTIIDPNLLQVTGHSDVPFSASGLTQPVTFFEVATLSNGRVLFLPTSQGEAGFQPFYLWDPATDTYTKFGPQTLTNFVGLISRSADHSKILGFASSVQGILYDATTDTFSGPDRAFGGAPAISPDGSQIASAHFDVSPPELNFYDSSLNQLASLPLDAFSVSGGGSFRLMYSLDGKRLYLVPDQGIGASGGNPIVTVIDTTTFSVLGVVPAFQFGAALPFSGEWITTFTLDETGMLFGAAFEGLGLLDLTAPTFLREPLPLGFFGIRPTLASISSPSTAQLSGASLSATDSYSVFFGAPPASPQSLQATNVTFQSQNFLNLTIPPAGKAGPANATLTRADGFFEIMPDAITYGPTILSVDGNAGPASGGSTITISGYGLSRPNTQVTIEGRPATVTQQFPAILDLGRLLPIERMTLTTPAGTGGKADVSVSTPAGSTTLAGGFQYLSSFSVHPAVGLLDAIVYDKLRQRLYISNQDHNRVEVFDLATNTFLSPMLVGNQPTVLALTPDGALLAVLDHGDSTVSVIDLATMTFKASFSLLSAADIDPGCGGVALNLTPAQPHRAVVDVACQVALFNGKFHLINLDTGSLDCTGVAGCAANGTDINFQTGLAGLASSSDGTKILLATSTGGGTPLPAGLLDLTANTLTAGTPVDTNDAAMSGDGTVFAANFALLDAALNLRGFTAAEPYADAGALSLHNVFGEKLNASGSLLFYPQDSGLDIFDVHTGRLVRHIVLPVAIPPNSGALALDESGTRMFLTTTTGVAIAQLDAAPLSIGHINPVAGPSGTTITIRGSGFQNGATVTFGVAQAATTFIDASTLSAVAPTLAPGVVQISVKNPDGSQYSIDGAYTVN